MLTFKDVPKPYLLIHYDAKAEDARKAVRNYPGLEPLTESSVRALRW
jgi:hypothetical protein